MTQAASSPSLKVIRHDRFVHVPSGKIRTCGRTNNQSVHQSESTLLLRSLVLLCGPAASGLQTWPCCRSPGWCSSWSPGPSSAPAPAEDSAQTLQPRQGHFKMTRQKLECQRPEKNNQQNITSDTFWAPRHPIICLSPAVTPATV